MKRYPIVNTPSSLRSVVNPATGFAAPIRKGGAMGASPLPGHHSCKSCADSLPGRPVPLWGRFGATPGAGFIDLRDNITGERPPFENVQTRDGDVNAEKTSKYDGIPIDPPVECRPPRMRVRRRLTVEEQRCLATCLEGANATTMSLVRSLHPGAPYDVEYPSDYNRIWRSEMARLVVFNGCPLIDAVMIQAIGLESGLPDEFSLTRTACEMLGRSPVCSGRALFYGRAWARWIARPPTFIDSCS